MTSPATDGTSKDRPRTTAKAERTRKRLLDATALVISRQGFSGTRLVDIGEVAEIQAPAIYYHYSSREELIEEVMFVGATAMLDNLRQALDAVDPGASTVDRIAAAVEAHLRMELGISDYSRAIIRNANQLPPNVSARAFDLVRQYNDIWRNLISALADEDQLRSELAPGAARMLVLGALNWAAEWFDPAAGPIDAVITTAQAAVLHALVSDEMLDQLADHSA